MKFGNIRASSVLVSDTAHRSHDQGACREYASELH